MNHPVTRLSPLLFVAGLFVSGCASHPLAKQEAGYPAEKVDARELFAENCAICHGENGRAHTIHGLLVGAQNLTKPDWQANATDEEIHNAIQSGPSVMPAFGKKLSPAEIDALVKYVRTFAKKN
jgi:mono/diheme cytochrome c family protein